MRAPADIRHRIPTAAVLLLLVAGGYVFRTVFSEGVMPPPMRMQGETTQAYRYTAMISSGEGIPAVDTLVMRPHGMRTKENSIFEEYIAGGMHRMVGGNLDIFLRFFSRFFPLLAIPVLFLWMNATGFAREESFTGAAVYAVFLPALLRTRGESLYRETVALPLLFGALMFADLSGKKKGREAVALSIAGAVLLFCALAAWKVTGILSFFLFAWLAFAGKEKTTVLPFAAAQILASAMLSHMIHDGALHSPATVMAVAAAVSSLTGKHRISAWAGMALSISAAFLFRSSSTGHVASVLLAKLRFFFIHPEDPMLLGEDARLFWVSGYTSPSWAQAILLFGVAALLGVFGWKQFRRKTRGTLLFWLVPVAAAGYFLFDRLHVILALAVIPLMVAALREKKYLLLAAVPVFGTLSMYAPLGAAVLSDAGLEFEETGSLLADAELNGLVSWFRENRGTALSYWHISGLLSAYAETPVVTHTFFENEQNRETIVEFSRRIYGTEAEMTAFMEEREARYLVYQADFVFDRTPQGLLYLAGLTRVQNGSLAVRLHYYPHTLERLVLVWQGPSLRVFELDGAPADSLERYVLWERDYGRFLNDYSAAFATAMFPVETGLHLAETGMETGDPERISAALLLFAGSTDEVPADVSIELLQHLLMAHLHGNYQMENLAKDFETYLDAWGPDPQIRLDLIRLLQDSGMQERAEHHMMILESHGRRGS